MKVYKMTSEPTRSTSPLSTPLAGWMARRSSLPVSVRAVFRYYSRTGSFDYSALRVRNWVEDTVDGYLQDAFEPIEKRLNEEFKVEGATFEYDTKLTLPVELTLGHLYQRALENSDGEINPVTGEIKTPIAEYFRIPYDKKHERRRRERLERSSADELDLVEQAEHVARLCTIALLDGDMRDAINDDEYEDFKVSFEVSPAERSQVAEIAQRCLEEQVSDLFADFPDAVKSEYETAKEASERHQDDDEFFRQLMRRAEEGSAEAATKIEEEYKFAAFESPPEVLTLDERELPYCKTQYERVGVIYDGMIEMFREAGIEIDQEFKHGIVLSIIGAQIWLDDIDDYQSDLNEKQLTPVTAEYLINETDHEAFEEITTITKQYLDRAVEVADRVDSHLTGIATEYIYLSGDTTVLPGSRRSQ